MFPYLHLGPVTIANYYLVISLSATLAALWFLKRAAARDMPRLIAIDLTIVTLVCGFAGARLLHVFFEEPDYYREQPLRVLEFWYGGFVYLGGLTGSLAGAWLFCRWKREPFLFWADLACVPASFAYAVGRIGCFLNGCCYGGHCTLPWAVNMDGDWRHPTQLYASGAEFLSLGVLLLMQHRLKGSGSLFALWLVLHGLGRLLMERFRDDPRGAPIEGLSLGTWMSFATVALGVGLALTRPARVVHDLQS